MVLGDEITIALVVPLFPVSYSLFPLHADRASPPQTRSPPHLYSSIYRYAVLRYTVLSVSTEMSLYRYLSIRNHIFGSALFSVTDLRSVSFR